MTLMGLFEADWRDVLWIGRVQWCNLTRRKDMPTSFGPAPVPKTLTIGLSMFDFFDENGNFETFLFKQWNFVCLVEIQFLCISNLSR